jgi:hypothetical protein
VDGGRMENLQMAWEAGRAVPRFWNEKRRHGTTRPSIDLNGKGSRCDRLAGELGAHPSIHPSTLSSRGYIRGDKLVVGSASSV